MMMTMMTMIMVTIIMMIMVDNKDDDPANPSLKGLFTADFGRRGLKTPQTQDFWVSILSPGTSTRGAKGLPRRRESRSPAPLDEVLGQCPAFRGISFRDGTGFKSNPGIPGFFGTGLA